MATGTCPKCKLSGLHTDPSDNIGPHYYGEGFIYYCPYDGPSIETIKTMHEVKKPQCEVVEKTDKWPYVSVCQKPAIAEIVNEEWRYRLANVDIQGPYGKVRLNYICQKHLAMADLAFGDNTIEIKVIAWGTSKEG